MTSQSRIKRCNGGSTSRTKTCLARWSTDGQVGQAASANRYCFNIGTWNVRGLNEPGKLDNVLKEMKDLELDILGLSETFWKGEGEFIKCLPNGEKYKIIYSGGDERRKGTAIILNHKTMNCVNYKIHISERILVINLKAKPVNLHIIQIYAPTADSEEDEIEEFYSNLKEAIAFKKFREAVLAMGDFNAKVGERREGDIVGPFGLGVQNERGERLINFCAQHDLFICNTWFEQKKSNRYTWTSPNKDIRNQIDYICMNKRYRNAIKNAKSRPSADCGSDHNPVIIKLNIKFKKITTLQHNKKWDTDKLKQNEVKNNFAELIEKLIAKKEKDEEIHTRTQNTEEKWQTIKNAITETAKEIVDFKKDEPRTGWMTEDILKKMDERKQYKNCTTQEGQEKYKSLKREVQKLCRKSKDAFLNNRCEYVEELDKNHNPKLHKEIRKLKTFTTKTSNGVTDKKGQLLTETNEMLDRWHEYCSELFQDERITPLISIPEENDIPQFNVSHIKRILENLSNNKSTGSDGIPAEFLKNLNDSSLQKITDIINKIYREGEIPEDFIESTFIPIPKINKAKNCSDFRTISLISHASKILLYILKERITPLAEENLGATQIGFRKGSGCREGISMIRFLAERANEMNKTIWCCFVDFQKAFDCINHNKLIEILKEIGIHPADIRIIKELYWKQKGKVKFNNQTSEVFKVKKGVRQGCILSPLLFNIYSQKIFQEAAIDHLGLKINGTILNNIRYADDTFILAENEKDLQTLMDKINNTCKIYGMKINMKKTKTMIINKRNNEICNIKINQEYLEQVYSYQYLGSLITEDGRCAQEIKRRIAMAKTTFWDHKELLRRNINLKTKLRLLKCYVFPIATYSSESWTFNKTIEKKITSLEMWCYRRILKISWKDKVTNKKVLQKMKLAEPNLLNTIAKRKLAYAGHILRGSSGSVLLNVLEGKMLGKRRRGRPRRKWTDDIKDWTRENSYGEAKRMAEKRDDWRVMVAELRIEDGN